MSSCRSFKTEELLAFERLAVPFCVLELRPEGVRLLAASEGFCGMFRAERTRLYASFGRLLADSLCPGDLAQLRPSMELAAASPDGGYSAVWHLEAFGGLWISCRGCVFCGEDGALLLQAYVENITGEMEQRREAATEKMRRDVLFRDILATTKTAIFWKDADRRFLGANRAFLDYYGFQDEQAILGKNDEEMGWHSDPEPYRDDELRVLREGVSTYRVPGKCFAGGENRNIVASKSPLVIGGRIVGLVGSFEDVTKETRQQEEISRLNAKLEAQLCDLELLMSISEVCIVKIRLSDYALLNYNEAMCRMAGYSHEEFARRFRDDLNLYFAGDSRPELERLKAAAREAVAARKRKFSLDLRVPSSGGAVRVGGTASFSDYDPETQQPRSMFAVYRDVTDLMEAQKKLELAELEMQRSALLEAENRRMQRMVEDVRAAEADMKESRRFYREVVHAAKLSTWEYDLKTRVIRMSGDVQTQTSSTLLGLPGVIENVPASLLGLISEENQAAFLRMYEEVAQGRNAACEAWFKPANGREPRCERITYIAVCGPDGTADHAIGFSQNITAEKKVEERYQRELGFLRQADENNLVAKGHYNLTRNIVLEYTTKNDSFFRVRPGIPYDEAFEALLRLPYCDSERRQIADKLDRKKLMERYQHGQMQTSLVYRRGRKGKLPVWISMNIHTYMMPETGNLDCFTYAYDVSGKMETDEIIGLISDEAFDYIGLIFTETGEFEFIKKSAEAKFDGVRQRTDYSRCCDEVRGFFKNEQERGQYDEAVKLENILAGLRDSGGRHTAIYRRTEKGRIICKQLDYVWFDRDSGIVLSVRSDVTASFEHDQQQLALIEAAKLEADRANEAKSSFLASMSHDLRTPLSGVLGFTALALRTREPEKKQEYLEKIDSSGRLLLDLVNDTLELSRIESGKAELERETAMPEEIVPAVVTALRPSAELKNIRLSADFSRLGTAPVWCDKLKVQKIALNLISNAIKYTPDGGAVSVRMIRSQGSGPDCIWTLLVEDNGIGMSEAFMERMFEPFSQEKRSESVKTPGTGLGLSIVKRYVDLMGGTIEASSRLHRGTRWIVSLPIRVIPVDPSRSDPGGAGAALLAGKRVLLCEDNLMNSEIASMLLKDRGMLVDTAENGEQGVRMFSEAGEGYYDAVLMDLRMPVMDGLAAARSIRAMDRRDSRSVPILAMTADAFEESMHEAESAGMNGYIMKPVEPQKLFGALSGVLSKN